MRRRYAIGLGLALVLLGAAAVRISTSIYTASSSNPANGVTAAVLSIDASHQGQTTVQLPYLGPGGSSQIDVDVREGGNVPAELRVTMVGHGTLVPYLRATAYPAGSPTPAADGPLTQPLTFSLGRVEAGTTNPIHFVFSWPAGSGGRDLQGATASVDLSFEATGA